MEQKTLISPEKIVLDTEFTGIHYDPDLISIAFIATSGQIFYAELNDFSASKCNDMVLKNVLPNLKYSKDFGEARSEPKGGFSVFARGSSYDIADKLRRWLVQFAHVEIWADAPVFDWYLLLKLLKFDLPKNIFYLPMDITTFMKVCGYNPDMNREEFIGLIETTEKHNALHDARVSKDVLEKIMLDEAHMLEKDE